MKMLATPLSRPRSWLMVLLVACALPAAAQTTLIEGVVSDDSNEPLIGVNIYLRSSPTIGTVTDIDGRYSLNVPEEGGVLVFSYTGFRSVEEEVGNRTTIDVVMTQDFAQLDEVVVIGYGTQKKSDVTGSVSSVSAEQLRNQPLTSLDQGLQGRAAGVQVTQTSGQPGGVASIRIRGGNSLQGGNEPLYVIDGFPVYGGDQLPTPGNGPNLNALATLNPNDIESIEVLKDASATAIYGARGANGVVLITTKSGRAGRDQINVRTYYGTQRVGKTIDVMNATQIADLVNEAHRNDGLPEPFTEQEIAGFGEGTDWQDEIFRTAPIQNYDVSFSGGDEKTTYAITASYFDQQGIVINSYFKRLSARMNLDRQISNRIKVGSHLTASRSTGNTSRTDTDGGGGTGAVLGAIMMNPIQGIYTDEEETEYTQLNSLGINLPNPYATAKEIKNENIATRFLGDVYGTWEVIDGLTARVSVGADILNNKGDHFIPSSIYQGTGSNGFAEVESRLSTTWLNENTLTYNRRFGARHNLTLLGGVTFQGNRTEFVRASSQNFVNNTLEENNLQSGSVFNTPQSSATEWGLISFIGRINYSLDDRYLVTFTARSDGSSRFGEGNKYGFFPSGAVAWRLIEEPFIRDLGVFDNLKLRASYGVTGNQEIGLYNSLATLTPNNYAFGGALVTGFRPNRVPNPELQWERTGQFDIGLDMGFFNNRLRSTIDLYSKDTDNLLFSANVPWTSGFSTALQNIGSVRNQGVEFLLEGDIFTGPFEWTATLNVSANRNEVVDLGDLDFFFTGGNSGHLKVSNYIRIEEGQPIGNFYGYVFDGVFQNQAEVDAGAQPDAVPGDRRYVDLNGDGLITADGDRRVIGNALPDFFGGFTNAFAFMGFELETFFQFSYGNDIMNFNRFELELPTGGQNVSTDLLDRWTPENPSDVFPRATRQRAILFSDRQLEDGSFLRLRTVTFAYTFPNVQTPWLRGLRLYFTGQNLWTLTDYSGYDPEVSRYGASNLNIGQDYGGFPVAKSWIFGLDVTF